MNFRSITIHNNQEELISMLKKTVCEPVVRNGLDLIRIMQRLDSKSKQHTKRFKLRKSELQDQALIGSVNLPKPSVNYKNVS